MFSWLATVNKAWVAAGVAFLAQQLAAYFGWNIPKEVQDGIVALIVGLAAWAVTNKPKPGTAVVEVKALPPSAQAAVIAKAEDVGKGVPQPDGTMTKSPAAAMLLALSLAFLAVGPLAGCGFMRAISGEPSDVAVTESPELRLAQSELLYQGALEKIIANTGPGELIEPGSPLALRLADANDAAYAALLVARDAVDNDLSTSATLVSAAWSAVSLTVQILSREGII